ncbi:hypothetical protein, partial [Synechococcus sp. Cruz-7E5]|uniref:hypothetical protein n=1 Tax=Synechococcus sp. Cruz-7E5 TaxID=2823730 RepID=UPI0020CE2CC2
MAILQAAVTSGQQQRLRVTGGMETTFQVQRRTLPGKEGRPHQIFAVAAGIPRFAEILGEGLLQGLPIPGAIDRLSQRISRLGGGDPMGWMTSGRRA